VRASRKWLSRDAEEEFGVRKVISSFITSGISAQSIYKYEEGANE
jgi:hypothetical protein